MSESIVAARDTGSTRRGPNNDAALQTLRDKVNLTIATQAKGTHGNGLDHGAVWTHLGAFGINGRQSIAQNGNVSGGSANIRNQCIVRIRQPPRPND